MRRLRHFFCSSPSFEKKQQILLERDETHHLRDVLRLAEGDSCLLSNGEGLLAEANVKSFTDSGTAKLIIEKVLKDEDSGILPKINVFFALPQKGKGDSLIEKAQEIGITGAYPLKTNRTVLKMTSASTQRVLSRWKKIVKNAAKQSRSLRLLDVQAPRKIAKALESISSEEEIIVLHPAEEAESFGDWILDKRVRALSKPINVFIGPEGGFTEDEVALLEDRGAKKICLGSNILRVETAVVSISACLKFLLST